MVEKRTCEICILAGGLSRRMGKDKTRLRLGRRSMLALIRAQARATGLPVRVIRRDAVPRCGPVGGIYSALQTTRAEAVLFLACDMPFVTAELIQWILEQTNQPAGKFRKAALQAGPEDGRPLTAPLPDPLPTRSSRGDGEELDVAKRGSGEVGLFICSNGVAGFPFLLSRACLPIVTAQIETGRFSIQGLAKTLEAKSLRLPRKLSPQLRNINTPAELRRARRLWENRPRV
jgi:molybdopterin-guanine dinucleotide biosynthesis protein A